MNTTRYDACFVGIGYVGLSTAAVFASKGLKILGLDVDESKVKKIAEGKAPFHEPRLDTLLISALKSGNFEASTELSKIAETTKIFISVGTPSQADGSIDLSYLDNVSHTIGKLMKQDTEYRLIIVKSTVIPGTTRNRVKDNLERASGKKCGSDFGLCSNPEFLSEGNAVQGTLHPDRILIGAIDARSATELKKFYEKIYPAFPNFLTTNTETAEMTKYANNAFLATKVSFINTIANICRQVPGVDVETVARGMGFDQRIGSHFLRAGPGYGGSCFHKDLQALIHYSASNDYDPVLLRATETVNETQVKRLINETKRLLGSVDKKRIAILGLAFKSDTDDIREAPAIRVIEGLLKEGAEIVAYDPMAMSNTRSLFRTIELAENPTRAIEQADCCIVLTEWDEFRGLRAEDFKKFMRSPNLIDARRIYDPSEFSDVNFRAIGLGPISK